MRKNENVFTQAKVTLTNGRIKYGLVLNKIVEIETGKDMMFISNPAESDMNNYRVKDIERISCIQIRGIDLLLK